MSGALKSRHGQRLWGLLPGVYRERDQEHGDLAGYLDALGGLLDEIHATLEQRRQDALPYECQSWLLPYFADLLDVQLVSPDVTGRRREVAHAVAWRQRKGTLDVAIAIAQALGFPAVVAQEGHLRVARTPHVGARLPTLRELGEGARAEPQALFPADAARRPGLPAVAVDFREVCRARRVAKATPASRETDFGDGKAPVEWQPQNSPFGVPGPWAAGSREPLSYQDMTVRTVDTRRPTWRHGHCHPRRHLLYAPVPSGFYGAIGHEVAWTEVSELCSFAAATATSRPWLETSRGAYRVHAEPKGSRWLIEQRLVEGGAGATRVEHVRRYLLPLTAEPDGQWLKFLEDFDTELSPDAFLLCVCDEPDPTGARSGGRCITISGGGWVDEQRALTALEPQGPLERFFEEPRSCPLGGCALDWIHLGDLRSLGLTPASLQAVRIENLVVKEGISTARYAPARVELDRCAVGNALVSRTPLATQSWLCARNSLLGIVQAPHCRLEYCTVVGTKALAVGKLEASDCILLAPLGSVPKAKVRYSYVKDLPASIPADWRICPRTLKARREPLFHANLLTFGRAGVYVLHPATDDSIRFGAEDGGELGAFHHRQYCSQERALLHKLREFLPVGFEPVLVFDPTWKAPLEVTSAPAAREVRS